MKFGFKSHGERIHPGLELVNELLGAPWKPPVEVHETETSMVVTADMAGVDPEDIHVTADGPCLKLTGERRGAEGDELWPEIPSGPFERTVRLRKDVDLDRRVVAFENGMLRVEMPKLS